MQDKAAQDVSRMLDRPGLRHMVELAEQHGAGSVLEVEGGGNAVRRESPDPPDTSLAYLCLD